MTLRELQASVQPLSNEDLDLVEGNRLLERWTAFVPEPAALVAAREFEPADEVTLAGPRVTSWSSDRPCGQRTRKPYC